MMEIYEIFFNNPSISAGSVLEACGINGRKWYEVKRGKSSFSPEEEDLILEQIHALKNFPIIPKQKFLDFLAWDKRIILKRVIPSFSHGMYSQIRKDLRSGNITVSDKKAIQLMMVIPDWQSGLPDAKEYIIKKEVASEPPIKNYDAFINANFSEREVSYYRITPLDIEGIWYKVNV